MANEPRPEVSGFQFLDRLISNHSDANMQSVLAAVLGLRRAADDAAALEALVADLFVNLEWSDPSFKAVREHAKDLKGRIVALADALPLYLIAVQANRADCTARSARPAPFGRDRHQPSEQPASSVSEALPNDGGVHAQH
ncbi:hypothetical protein [Sphingobium sp.]|uniref:hypothetical protein n=1 Tax=Sphingobium sp. TaxID=1912891 RepID=UPI002BCC9DAF|nr:hypothetical protein [Sphingobium sp.]HUD92309.1 hypothetical protein [Sphingobium sp.]